MKNISAGSNFSSLNASYGKISHLGSAKKTVSGSLHANTKDAADLKYTADLTERSQKDAREFQPEDKISTAPKNSDTRSLDKDIDDAKWYVKHYTDKLIDAKTSDEKVMYHKLLKQSQATLDSLGASSYSSKSYGSSYSSPSAHSSASNYSSENKSKTGGNKDIDDAKWYVEHYTKELGNAITSKDQVMFHKLLQDSQAKLDSLQSKNYPSSSSAPSHTSASSTPAESKEKSEIDKTKEDVDYYKQKYFKASTKSDEDYYADKVLESQSKLEKLEAGKSSSYTPWNAPKTSSSNAVQNSHALQKSHMSEIDKLKSEVDHFMDEYMKSKKGSYEENYYLTQYSQTKVEYDHLKAGKTPAHAHSNSTSSSHTNSSTHASSHTLSPTHAPSPTVTSKASKSEIDEAKNNVKYYTDKCNDTPKHSSNYKYYYDKYVESKQKLDNLEGNGKASATSHSTASSSSHAPSGKASQADIDDAKDNVQYYKDKCNTTSKYASNYQYYYDKYTESKQKLKDLESTHSSSSNDEASKSDNKTSKPSISSSAKDLQSEIEELQDDVDHYKKKFSQSKYGSSDYDHYLDLYAKAQTKLEHLESKKPTSTSSTQSTSAQSSAANSHSSSASKNSAFEKSKLQGDVDYYKDKFLDSSEGSSDYDYYLNKYSEAKGKLDNLHISENPSSTPNATTSVSKSNSSSGSKSETEKLQEDVDYFKEKFMESASGTSDSDYYLKKYSEASVKLDNLNKTQTTSSYSSTSGSASTSAPASKASQTDIDKLKSDVDYFKDKWYAAEKGSSDDDYYWGKYSESKNKLEKLENPQVTVSALTINASTPSSQAPVPKSKNITKAQEQIDVLMQKANDPHVSAPERKTILDKVKDLNEQASYEHKVESMEADTGDMTPATGHNHLKADYVISSHGSYKPADGWVDLPPGIFIRTNAKHGSPINNGLGWALEEDRASNYRFSELWTNKIRNYKITKELSFENNDKAKIIQVPIPKDEQHILDIVGPYAPTNFDPAKDKPILFDAAFCLADKLTDNYEYTFGADGPYKK